MDAFLRYRALVGLRGRTCCGTLAVFVVSLLAPLSLLAQAPAWWQAYDILVSGATPDDFAVVNQGQVKNIAKQAYLEMELRFPAGAGLEIESIVNGWTTAIAAPAAPSDRTDDFAAANQGQVKSLAKAFYDRLYDIGVRRSSGQRYPWLDIATDIPDNYALANVGQLKFAFSFEVPIQRPTADFVDLDTDGLDDSWENWYFGNLASTADEESDGDAISNLTEYVLDFDPKSPAELVTTLEFQIFTP